MNTLGKVLGMKPKLYKAKTNFATSKRNLGFLVIGMYFRPFAKQIVINTFSVSYRIQISTLIFHFVSRNVKLCSGINHLLRHENQYINWNLLLRELVMLFLSNRNVTQDKIILVFTYHVSSRAYILSGNHEFLNRDISLLWSGELVFN